MLYTTQSTLMEKQVKTGEYKTLAGLKQKYFILEHHAGGPLDIWSSYESAKEYCEATTTNIDNVKCYYLQKADWHWEKK